MAMSLVHACTVIEPRSDCSRVVVDDQIIRPAVAVDVGEEDRGAWRGGAGNDLAD